MKATTITHPRAAGFTLVEVMVAMVIGMIGIIIMMQVFATAEGQKRSTTGTGDAQSTGAIALHELQRDIRQSGYGFNSLSLLNCSMTLPSGIVLPALAPTIVKPRKADGTLLLPAGDADTDTLLIVFGNSAVSPEGDSIISPGVTALTVKTPGNFDRNDHVVATPLSDGTMPCSVRLRTVESVAEATSIVTLVADNADTTLKTGLLFNFGAAPTIRAYAIRGGNLTVCDYMVSDCSVATNYAPIANNIVSLRAQYGRDTTIPMDGVDTWDATTPTTACQWVGAPAMRLALLARNSQVDKDQITAAAPTWEGSTASPLVLTDRANWQNYRYKVFETIVPIRNLPWMAKCP